jgi:3-hydroxyisobutyrate dehydrogenase
MGKKVGFIGLGVMGAPMAGHLARAGNDLCVYNRTAEKARAWTAEYGGRSADSPAGAAEGAEAVFVCVGRDDDVREVILGPSGCLDSLEAGALLVDHTTASATLARELEEKARERSVAFVDAPVSGGQAGAENGALAIMAGGEVAACARAEEITSCYARAFSRMGAAGSGQLAKMVNQICIAGLVQGLAEGMNFAELSGLDPARVFAAISRGAAQSWQMENRYETMIDGKFDFGFAVDWMRKDLNIAFKEAERNGVELPVARLVDDFYADVQSLGGSRWDTSSLIARMRARRRQTD